MGRVYLKTVVDTWGSLDFGKLYNFKRPETEMDLLYSMRWSPKIGQCVKVSPWIF